MKKVIVACVCALAFSARCQNVKTVMADTNGVIVGNARLEARIGAGGSGGVSAAIVTNIVASAISNIPPVTAQSVGAFTNETTTLAQAAARGGFAGTESISPAYVYITAASGYTQMSAQDYQYSSSDNSYVISLGIGGLILNYGLDNYVWQIQGQELSYTTYAGSAYWSFERQSGNYTVAATSDLAAYTTTNAFMTYTNSVVPMRPYHNGTTNGLIFTLDGITNWVIKVTQ